MSPAEYTAIHTDLSDQLVELKIQLSRLGRYDAATDDWVPLPEEPSDAEPDPNDLGDRSEAWQEIRGTVDTLETRFHNVSRALGKLAAGTYGVCEICEETIAPERLQANPAARTCAEHFAEEPNLPR